MLRYNCVRLSPTLDDTYHLNILGMLIAQTELSWSEMVEAEAVAAIY